MEREKIYLKLFGKNLVGFKKDIKGNVIGTGMLTPIIERLGFFTMLLVQGKFYAGYKNLGTWKGNRVANTFAPPIGSRPMYHLLASAIKGRLGRHPVPVAMTFAVTYKCQCKCVHCSAGRHARPDVPELSTREAKRLIDESQELGVSIIAFTGGEPLLRDDIFDLIAHVDGARAVPLLFTNGQFLTEETVDKLADAGLYSAFVSLDSPFPEEHDRLRNMPGLFDAVMKGIRTLKSRGIFVGFSSYATKTATERGIYKKIYHLARENHLDNVMLFDAVPTGNMLKDTREILTVDQRNEIEDFSNMLFANSIIPPLSSQSWQNSIEGYLGGIGCLAANIQYYASAYGDITPCDFTPLSFGNIRQEPLRTIWRRMIAHPEYKRRSSCCKMQNRDFRQQFIDPILDDAPLPYDIEKIQPFASNRVKLG